ncbi:MAG: hypothetical protein AB7K09_24185, partial [Planctomycetota bacterium]
MNPAEQVPEIDGLIPLGISGDLPAHQQAEFEARVSADASFADEVAAYRETLARLHELRAQLDRISDAGMPTELSRRVKAAVLGSLPTPEAIEAGTDVPGFADVQRPALQAARLTGEMPAAASQRVMAAALGSLPTADAIEAGTDVAFAAERVALHAAQLAGQMPAAASQRVVAAALGSLPTAEAIEAGADVHNFAAAREQLRNAGQNARPMPADLASRVTANVLASLPAADLIEAGEELSGFASLRSTLRSAQPTGPMPANLAARVSASVLDRIQLPTAAASRATADSDDAHAAGGTLHSIFQIARHPAVAAMLILSLGLGLLLLPDRQPTGPGVANGGNSPAVSTPAPDSSGGTPGTGNGPPGPPAW